MLWVAGLRCRTPGHDGRMFSKEQAEAFWWFNPPPPSHRRTNLNLVQSQRAVEVWEEGAAA